MDRLITNVGESIYEWMLSKPDQNTMVGLAKLSAAMLGSSTIVNGLSCVPTGPASLQVVVNPGEIYSLANLEASVCGTLPTDSHQIVKQGVILDAYTSAAGALPAPGSAGQSVNYLIEAQYADSDISIDPTTGTTPVVLQFYNSSNPQTPYSGPGGLGATSTTFRKGVVSLQIKAGAAATTGSQTTPSPDAGWTGLWVVTVANGQTQILAGNIAQYAGAPILPSSLLASIQNGNLSYAVATGTANAHVVALTPALASRVDGMVIRYKAPAANTTALTLNDGLGAVAVVGGAHAALQGGETVTNGDVWVQWNSSIGGGSYIMLDSSGGALQIAPATQSQHAVQLGQVQFSGTNYATTTGSANTYAVTLSPAPAAITDGFKLRLKINATNTGASTLNVNGAGVVAILGGAAQPLQTAELVVNGYVELEYSSFVGSWLITSPCTGANQQVVAGSKTLHAINRSQVLSLEPPNNSANISSPAASTAYPISVSITVPSTGSVCVIGTLSGTTANNPTATLAITGVTTLGPISYGPSMSLLNSINVTQGQSITATLTCNTGGAIPGGFYMSLLMIFNPTP